MAILKPKRGSGLPSGLQQHELAIDVLNRRIYLGNTGGTGDIISSHITDYVTGLNSATGAVNLYAGSGLSVATSTSIRGITFTNTGVLSINSATGAITNVARTNVAQTFTGLQSFSTGISAAGGTFSALTRFTTGISASGGATFSGQSRFLSGLSAAGISLGGNLNFIGSGRYITASELILQADDPFLAATNTINLRDPSNNNIQITSSTNTTDFFVGSVLSWPVTSQIKLYSYNQSFPNEYSSSWSLGPATAPLSSVNYTIGLPADNGTVALTKSVVSSFNGLTGAVTGVTTGTANTFGPVQSFTNGISASGGVTFANDIRINNFIVGRGSGNVTTNTAFGVLALSANTSGSANSAFGNNALAAVTTGSGNVAVGRRALLVNTTGGNNVSIGSSSLIGFNGSETIAIGANSVGSIASGTGGIYIGFGTDSSGANDIVNEIVIGTSVAGLGSNTTVIGPTTQVSATIRGLVNAPSGLSASGISSGAYILTPSGIKSLTGTTYTFLASDNGTVLTHNNSSGCTFTIPTGLPVGYSTTVLQLNSAGTVRFIAASGVTLNAFGSFTSMAGQHASASLISYTTNIFNLSGNLI